MVSLILDFLERHRDDMVADLQDFVERETPSTDKQHLDAFAQHLAGYAGRHLPHSHVTILDREDNGDHVRIDLNDGEGPAVLLLAHFDTVWPLGTLDTMPFHLRDDRAYGPGAFDMKAGLVQALWALRALRATGSPLPRLTLLCNSDEEIGSHSSRAIIEDEARRAAAALVFEPSADGDLKTARKGVGAFHIEVTGRPAHAASDPNPGISAIDELARIVLELHAQTRRDLGTTVNVGVISGGTRSNVVAAQAYARVDIRVATNEEGERMTAYVHGLRTHHPKATIRVTGGVNRPPLQRTPASAHLFERARRCALELGFEVDERSTAGASDGNFAAAVGAAVLDGLGAVGAGAHAHSEHVRVDHLPRRAALAAHLLADLAGPG